MTTDNILFHLIRSVVCGEPLTDKVKEACTPEALDKGCFVLAGIDKDNLLQAVDTAVSLIQNGDYGIPVPNYTDENVSTKVINIIQSYTGVVDKMVWRKY